MTSSLISSFRKHVPGGQLKRYLVVGIWNTAFGYGTYAFFNWMLEGRFPASYMLASLLASVVNITVAFLGYKWFVFKTHGNYLKEWVRCLIVYSGSIAVGLALLPGAVFLVEYLTGNPRAAPYIAGAAVMALQVVGSFIGHSRYSFGGDRSAGGGSGSAR